MNGQSGCLILYSTEYEFLKKILLPRRICEVPLSKGKVVIKKI